VRPADRIFHPNPLQVSGDLRVLLRRVEVGTAGVLLVIEATVPAPTRPEVVSTTGERTFDSTHVGWRGFDELRDDLGYHYLATRFEEDSSKDKGAYRTSLARQSFFPTLASGAGRICLSSTGYFRHEFSAFPAGLPLHNSTFVRAPLTFPAVAVGANA
jgi:hypothetical protein